MSTSSSNKQINVTVIGAGIVGSAIAYTLAKRGATVTVIDKGRPGGGATSHSFAWINATAKNPRRYASGICHVLVNGEMAMRDGARVPVNAGQVIREFAA